MKFHGSKLRDNNQFLTLMTAQRMIRKGCEAFLAYILDTNVHQPDITQVPMVNQFKDEFSKELLGLPPECVNDFATELASGTALISKITYRMAPVELKELMIKLQDLLDKSFMRRSVSP